MNEKVRITLTLPEIPTNNATFSLTVPFNARNEVFNVTPVYQLAERKGPLNSLLYNCDVRYDPTFLLLFESSLKSFVSEIRR